MMATIRKRVIASLADGQRGQIEPTHVISRDAPLSYLTCCPSCRKCPPTAMIGSPM